MKPAVTLGGWALLAAGVTLSGDAAAVDPFEIQVYDGTANAKGEVGGELHVNDWVTGHRDAMAPELPLHAQFHATFEPSFGVTSYWELGAYLQTALRQDQGVSDYAGAKLRSKFVTPPGWDPHWRLGVNLELSLLPEIYDHARWGSEVRPIVAWSSPEWLFAANPILDQSLAGPDAAVGPSFEPAVKVARALGPVAIGIEYYASFGPLSAPHPWRSQEHYVYEVVDLWSAEHVEFNLGVGEGLTSASAGLTVKAIVGYTFEMIPSDRASKTARWLH